MNNINLENKALEIRNKTLDLVYTAGQGHIGGALSSIDILTVIFYDFLKKNCRKDNCSENCIDITCKDRDRFILSKGHTCIPLYIILNDLGYFKDITAHRGNNHITGYPDTRVPGIEILSGSLGHGLGIASGVALSAKLDKKDFLTIVLLGDAECYEGSNWESAMFAAHHKLNNLIAIIDRNQQGVTDYTENYNKLESLDLKFQAFNWNTVRINGHSIEEIKVALDKIKESDKPLMIIADTIKGKGISFMQRVLSWHHGTPTKEQYDQAKRELSSI